MNKKHLKLAADDIVSAVKSWRIWLLLGWQDIRLRYRRSQLGPFWITISMAVMIYSMGFLYGNLFKVDLSSYYPFLACGIIVWALMSTVILESGDAFMESQNYIKQIKLPYSIYVLRVLTRNIIILFHNVLPLIPILIYFRIGISFYGLLSILFGFVIIVICGFSFGMILAMLGSRFRDIKQIIASLVQVTFLLTPIMWQPSMLPDKYKFAAEINPFNQIIELLRAPLTGHLPSQLAIVYSSTLAVGGFLVLFLLLWRARHRISFWV